MSKYMLMLVFIVGCGKLEKPPYASDAGPTKPPVDAAPAVASAPAACIDPYRDVETRTRVAAEFYLGHPVICGRGGTNGATCLDTHGGLVWCPITPTDACSGRKDARSATVVIRGITEAPAATKAEAE